MPHKNKGEVSQFFGQSVTNDTSITARLKTSVLKHTMRQLDYEYNAGSWMISTGHEC